MPLHRRATKRWRNFNFPMSYKVGVKDRMKDARNVCTIQDILETRHGISRWNTTAFSGAPLSISYFKDENENSYLIIKDGSILYRAMANGAHTEIKTGLSVGTKHRGITFGGRHIIAIEGDGLFSYDGTTLTELGQAVPAAPNVAASGSGNTLDASDYQVALTFYSSTYGFETNKGANSSNVTISSGQQIDVTSIPSVADNDFIDKVRIYLKDVTTNSAFIFWAEINLGTTTNTIDDNVSSTQTPPTTHAEPISGGGKYPVVYGQSLAYSGNGTFKSDVFISERFLPDAFDGTETSKTFNVAGNGPVTGLGVGYFDGDNQNPYIVAFKKRHIELFTEASGAPQQIVISNELGCVSHDTIKVINGDVFFLSAKGWHAISNGKMIKTKDRNDSIDNGDINDIFNRSGFTFEVNKTEFSNFFSVYYPTLQQYLTFCSEGGNTSIYKSYNYEFTTGGFRSYDFPVFFTGGTIGEDSASEEVIYLCGENGYIYTHSIKEEKGTDVDRDGNEVAINAFALMYWEGGEDMDASYNFGPLILRALAQDNDITVKFFLGYTQQDATDIDYSFVSGETGFILDLDRLDQGILSDGRTIVRYVGEILRSGQSLLIGFYKSQKNESMAIIEGQLDISKNGNTN